MANNNGGIPRETYSCQVVDSEIIDRILNESGFLYHDDSKSNPSLGNLLSAHRKYIERIGKRVYNEHVDVRKNLTLRIRLCDEGVTGAPVKHIDIISGEGINRIECSRNEDGSLSWMRRQIEEIRGETTETYQCENEITSESILDVMNRSRFLVHDYDGLKDDQRKKDDDHRNPVKCAAQKVKDERSNVRKNLTVHLILIDTKEETNSFVKHIKIVSGNGDSVIECSLKDGNIIWDHRNEDETATTIRQLLTCISTIDFPALISIFTNFPRLIETMQQVCIAMANFL